MKKLNRLQIDTGKMIRDEELVRLKGGYEGACCTCHAWSGTVIGHIYGSSIWGCNNDCFYAMGTGFGTWDCII